LANDPENADDRWNQSLSEDKLRSRAERLIAEGRMPSFEDVLKTVRKVAYRGR
jgi:hypothetical protein